MFWISEHGPYFKYHVTVRPCVSMLCLENMAARNTSSPPRSSCKAGSASCRQKTTLKEEYSKEIKAVTTSIKPFLTLGRGALGEGVQGVYDI